MRNDKSLMIVEEEKQNVKKIEDNELLFKKLFLDAENLKIDQDMDIHKISIEVNL